jgi:NAD(P)-dependent dehydrogenase (short-subunit alcohol dehydrogenase family)
MNRPAKRVCLLTGASGRLGTTFCRLNSHRYDIVAIYGHRLPAVSSQMQRLVDPLHPRVELDENESPVFVVQADLTDERQLQRAVDLALARYGAARHTSASILEGHHYVEQIDAQLQLNFVAPLRVVAAVAHAFWFGRAQENAARNRNVVNVSSTSGVGVFPGIGHGIYGASKAALNHITRHLAHELSPIGIRVNATAPASFPRVISTESVVNSIVEFDDGNLNGKVLVLEHDRRRLI